MTGSINSILGIDSNVDVTGPYLIGQKPYSCGHYYPDVLLVKDSLQGNKVNRDIFCFKCNLTYPEEIPIESVNKSLLSKLANDEKIVYGTIQELAKFREEKLKSFFIRSDW